MALRPIGPKSPNQMAKFKRPRVMKPIMFTKLGKASCVCNGIAENGEVVAMEDFVDVG